MALLPDAKDYCGYLIRRSEEVIAFLNYLGYSPYSEKSKKCHYIVIDNTGSKFHGKYTGSNGHPSKYRKDLVYLEVALDDLKIDKRKSMRKFIRSINDSRFN